MKDKVVHVESRAVTSRAQLVDLLSVFGVVGNFLTRPQVDYDGKPISPELDGGAQCAAESTLCRVCARLDAMLADDARWSLDQRNDLETHLIESYTASTDMFKKQAQLSSEMMSPHARLHPVLARLRPGVWMALKGDLANIDASICGIGETPAAALECFDAAFNGKLTPAQIKYIQSITNEETEIVGRDGSEQIDGTSSSGDANAGDSETTGEDSGLSSPSDSESPDSDNEEDSTADDSTARS